MRDCPKCGDPIADNAICCDGCGWAKGGSSSARQQPASNPLYFLCSHDDRGERCGKAGTLAQSTLGGGPWFCPQHFPPFRGMEAMGRRKLPNGFRSIGALLPKRRDPEADAERAAIQAEGERVPVYALTSAREALGIGLNDGAGQ